MKDLKATIFNIQRYSIDDGPGIRTIVFFKGCPLRCLWCCNPESQNFEPEISHNSNICLKCGKCAQACPQKAITMTENGPVIDRSLCIACGTCTTKCVTEAIKMIGEVSTVQDVFNVVIKDAMFYNESGGGVTVSGGEPLMRADFVKELFSMVKEHKINTAVETCGFVPWEAFEKVLDVVDLFLFDIKQMDNEKHQKLTAVGNELIHSNLRKLVERKANVLIRLPLIPTLNDDEEELNKIADMMEELNLTNVELMPYHDYGSGKYGQLDKEYELSHLKKHSDDRVKQMSEIFTRRGLDCKYIK